MGESLRAALERLQAGRRPLLFEPGAYQTLAAGSSRHRSAGRAPVLRRPVLIYTPGVSLNNVAHRIKDDEWSRTLAVNLTGAMMACRGVLPRMRELGFGRIILVSSVLARIGVPGTLGYSATKAALCSMVRVIGPPRTPSGWPRRDRWCPLSAPSVARTVDRDGPSRHTRRGRYPRINLPCQILAVQINPWDEQACDQR